MKTTITSWVLISIFKYFYRYADIVETLIAVLLFLKTILSAHHVAKPRHCVIRLSLSEENPITDILTDITQLC